MTPKMKKRRKKVMYSLRVGAEQLVRWREKSAEERKPLSRFIRESVDKNV